LLFSNGIFNLSLLPCSRKVQDSHTYIHEHNKIKVDEKWSENELDKDYGGQRRKMAFRSSMP
jgi:hypothetical protein